jgi:hypothetical protein
MNCAHPIRLANPDNEYLRTTYSPFGRGEQFVNKLYRPIAAAFLRWRSGSYSLRQAAGAVGGEYLLTVAAAGIAQMRGPRGHWLACPARLAHVPPVFRSCFARAPLVLRSYCCTPRGIKKATLRGRPVLVEKDRLGGGLGCGGSLARSLSLGGCFPALQVGFPPLPFLSLIVLLAHNALYIPNIIRLFGGL